MSKSTKHFKDVELCLIAELMNNSRRSDKELAKAIGVSKPTISRTIKKIEKEGFIREYTLIPDFTKLGFEILAITLVRYKRDLPDEEVERLIKEGREMMGSKGKKAILALKGTGLNHNVAIISMHENYASYVRLVEDVKMFPASESESVESFIISLKDKVQFRSLTFSFLSSYLEDKAKGVYA